MRLCLGKTGLLPWTLVLALGLLGSAALAQTDTASPPSTDTTGSADTTSGDTGQSSPAVPTLHLLRPVSNAIVRETVALKLSPRDLPPDGYVAITVDGQFLEARPIPKDRREPLYRWNTKAPYSTQDDPDTKKYWSDGSHTLKLEMYSTTSRKLGEASVPIRLANKISLVEGVRLVYHWSMNEQLRYQRRTNLTLLGSPTSTTAAANPERIQLSLVRFNRSVEDTTGGDFLIRDKVLPGGYIVNRGQEPQRVDALYHLKSKYRTTDKYGAVLREMAPLTKGDHFGFSIPVLPERRVNTGDSWQAPVEISLEWASTDPASITVEGRLEGFEWENGYPTARVRETYTGPATFNTAGSQKTAISAPTVRFERLIYFAYNSGRVIRTETNLEVTADLTPTQLGALGAGSSTGGSTNATTQGYANTAPTGEDQSNPESLPNLPTSFPGNLPPGAMAMMSNLQGANGPARSFPVGQAQQPAEQSSLVKLQQTEASALIQVGPSG